uniref:Uncharacterized protein n=1 Tax=Arundo donax TaxID=35708 RepID=A0A0A9EJU4_ARUDO
MDVYIAVGTNYTSGA